MTIAAYSHHLIHHLITSLVTSPVLDDHQLRLHPLNDDVRVRMLHGHCLRAGKANWLGSWLVMTLIASESVFRLAGWLTDWLVGGVGGWVG